ncbi:hypothetical protein ACLX1H_008880 [Fusarium chlamydosporum]
MVKLLNIAYVLFVAMGVQADCKKNCYVRTEKPGLCYYECHNTCPDVPAEIARTNFLDALKSAGYRCSSESRAGVTCAKEGAFGNNCDDHYWKCGDC